MDYSVIFNLIKVIIVAILKSAGVFDEIEAAGIDTSNLLAMLGITMSDSEPTE